MTEREFITLVQKHSGIIRRILYLYVDDPEDQKDLEQEIRLQAWKSLGRFRKDAAFSTWLYRVALNTVLTFRRRQTPPSSSLDRVDMMTEVSGLSDHSELLLRAIKGLSDIDKTIITLHLEDYDHPEIADITGLTKNNVAVKLHRIKEALKKKLNARYDK